MAHISFIAEVVGELDKETVNGEPKLKLQAVENHQEQNATTGQWETVGTTLHNIELWSQAALDVAAKISDGDTILVVGEQTTRAYPDANGTSQEYTFLDNPAVALYQK